MGKETAAQRAAREALEPPEDWQDQPVHLALVRVMRDVRELGKLDRNDEEGGGFAFRGIDAVVNAVGPILRKHGVLCTPKLLKSTLRTAETDRGVAVAAYVKVRYVFTGPMGDRHKVVVPGEAMDFGDKAVNKAMSVAWRTCLLHSLQIPTGERDPDSFSYQRAGDGQGAAQQGHQRPNAQRGASEQRQDPRQPLWNEIGRIGDQLAMTRSAVRADFFRWSEGKQIDGRNVSLELLGRYRDELAQRLASKPDSGQDGPPPNPDNGSAERAAEEAAAEMLQSELGGEPVTGE